MGDVPANSDHIAARFFAALFAVGAAVILTSIAWEIWTGVSYAKIGGPISRASDPQGYWTNVAFHGAGVLVFVWAARLMSRSVRSASRS